MQSFLLSVVIALLALAVGFLAGIRYQRDGVIFDPAAYAAPPSRDRSNIEAPLCFDFCPGVRPSN